MGRIQLLLYLYLSTSLFAQQPQVPEIQFQSVPDPLKLPADLYLGEAAGVAVNSKGYIFVLSRGNSTGPAYGASAAQLLEFDADGKFLTMWNNIHRPDGMTIGPDGNVYIGELNGIPGVDDAPGLGHRVSILDSNGKLLARFGESVEGEGPGQFIAPHGIAVDSQGDIYVGEVSYTIRGKNMDPPRELRSLSKLRRTSQLR